MNANLYTIGILNSICLFPGRLTLTNRTRCSDRQKNFYPSIARLSFAKRTSSLPTRYTSHPTLRPRPRTVGTWTKTMMKIWRLIIWWKAMQKIWINSNLLLAPRKCGSMFWTSKAIKFSSILIIATKIWMLMEKRLWLRKLISERLSRQKAPFCPYHLCSKYFCRRRKRRLVQHRLSYSVTTKTSHRLRTQESKENIVDHKGPSDSLWIIRIPLSSSRRQPITCLPRLQKSRTFYTLSSKSLPKMGHPSQVDCSTKSPRCCAMVPLQPVNVVRATCMFRARTFIAHGSGPMLR